MGLKRTEIFVNRNPVDCGIDIWALRVRGTTGFSCHAWTIPVPAEGPKTGQLVWIATAPEARRLGVATAMIWRLLETYRTLQCHMAYAPPEAVGLLTACGFRRVDAGGWVADSESKKQQIGRIVAALTRRPDDGEAPALAVTDPPGHPPGDPRVPHI